MFDCSPSAGTQAPELRVAKAEQRREAARSKNETLKQNLKDLESELSTVFADVEECQSVIQAKKQEYQELMREAQELEQQAEKLDSERRHLDEASSRYQQLATKCGSVVDVSEVQKNIDSVRKEIIQMEKEIIELQKQAQVNDKVAKCRQRRTELIQENARLIESLNALTVQLKVLQYAGDTKLITDSEMIIEKQLASEELRDELETTLRNKIASPSTTLKSRTTPVRSPMKTPQKQKTAPATEPPPCDAEVKQKQEQIEALNEEIKSLYEKTGAVIDTSEVSQKKRLQEMTKLKRKLQLAKEKLNGYLKRDRRVDDLVYLKKRKEGTIHTLDISLERAKMVNNSLRERRNDIEETHRIMAFIIGQLKGGTELDTEMLNSELDQAKGLYSEAREKLKAVQQEIDKLNGDPGKAQSLTLHKKIEKLREDVEGLEAARAELKEKQEVYKRLNSEQGMQSNLELQREIMKLEEQINEVSARASQLRKQKKNLNQSIQYTISELRSYGVNPPPYQAPRKR